MKKQVTLPITITLESEFDILEFRGEDRKWLTPELKMYLDKAYTICTAKILEERLKCIPSAKDILEIAYMLSQGFEPKRESEV